MAMTTTPPSDEPEAHGSAGRQGGRRGQGGRLRRVWGRRASRLAVGVVAAAVALTAAAVAFGQGIGPFQDVGDDHYARDSTQWAVQNRITFGCRDGTYFCPERTVNRAESVTFLHRYHNNVIGLLENRIRTLENRAATNPGTGFGNDPIPTTTTRPLRKYTTRGTQHNVQSFNLSTGTYAAVFTLEAAKAAASHHEDTDGTAEPVTLIQVEYRENSSSAWKTVAVYQLRLVGDAAGTRGGATLPGAGVALFREVKSTNDNPVEVQVENVPGRLPPSGHLRVSAYMADDTLTPNDPDDDPDRTTKYDFSWGLVLTEIRS